jgi:hypothetical protein
MQGKLLRQVLDKMMTSDHAQNARVQVLLPDGKYYDITSLQLSFRCLSQGSKTL